MRERCCSLRRRWRDGLPQSFACGCSLRTGAYVVAALSLLYALLLVGAPWTVGICGFKLCKHLDGGLVGELLAWIAAALLLLASMLMVIGASTGRRELLLPWLGFSSLYVALWLLAAIVALIFISVQGAYLLAVAAFFVALNMAVLPLYFLLTVSALYVRIGDESREATERALGGTSTPPALHAAAAAAADSAPITPRPPPPRAPPTL